MVAGLLGQLRFSVRAAELVEDRPATNGLTKVRPVAPYDPDPLKAAKKCFDRETGKRVSVDDLETYREALAQYHLYPETKFANGQHRDHGPTQGRHIKIDVTDR